MATHSAKAGRKARQAPRRRSATTVGARSPLWSGRFSEPVSERVKRYTASIGFDQRLAREDIRGSLAHARMLHASGILGRDDLKAIERGLASIQSEIDEGKLRWS